MFFRISDDRNKILMGVYNSSWATTMITLTVVVVLEIFMLVYSILYAPYYGVFLWRYRSFYISLLTMAVIYIFLNIYVKKDIEFRYRILNIANPVYAAFFFAWALGITWNDLLITGNLDVIVFMTFSLIVPLGFYLLPSMYVLIAGAADALMVVMAILYSGTMGLMINLSIFIIFQFVLGISFLYLKERLNERIYEEQKNAGIDVLTGFFNRRTYSEDIDLILENPELENLVYIVADMNGLKRVNDNYGHQAGDELIIGAAECLQQSFDTGKIYRIGGDEFVVLISASEEELSRRFDDYEKRMKAWSDQHEYSLSTSYGYVRVSDFPDCSITEIVKKADERMYQSKQKYYRSR